MTPPHNQRRENGIAIFAAILAGVLLLMFVRGERAERAKKAENAENADSGPYLSNAIMMALLKAPETNYPAYVTQPTGQLSEADLLRITSLVMSNVLARSTPLAEMFTKSNVFYTVNVADGLWVNSNVIAGTRCDANCVAFRYISEDGITNDFHAAFAVYIITEGRPR